MKILVFNDYCVTGNIAMKANISVLSQNGHEVFGLPTKKSLNLLKKVSFLHSFRTIKQIAKM